MKSKLSLFKKIIVIVILLLVGVLGVLGVTTVKTYIGGATAGYDPKEVAPTPEEKKVTVSWNSDKECIGYLEYGTTPASLLLRSKDEGVAKSNHSIVIEPLKATTTYYFRIRCGTDGVDKNEWEIFDNNGIPYSFKTKAGAGGSDLSLTPTVTPQVTVVPISGSTTTCQPGTDYDGDGAVTSHDMLVCRSQGPTVVPAKAATSSGSCQAGVDYDSDGVVTSHDMAVCRNK